jgi:hypothetical protein
MIIQKSQPAEKGHEYLSSASTGQLNIWTHHPLHEERRPTKYTKKQPGGSEPPHQIPLRLSGLNASPRPMITPLESQPRLTQFTLHATHES